MPSLQDTRNYLKIHSDYKPLKESTWIHDGFEVRNLIGKQSMQAIGEYKNFTLIIETLKAHVICMGHVPGTGHPRGEGLDIQIAGRKLLSISAAMLIRRTWVRLK